MNAKRIWNWNDIPGKGLVTNDQWPLIAETFKLTRREYEVCQLLFYGRTRNEIADQLGVSFSTIRQYCEQLHAKLRVGNRVDFVLRVIQVRDLINKVNERMSPNGDADQDSPSDPSDFGGPNVR